MIVHLFNSSLVSGPETLVLPALRRMGGQVEVIFLSEERKREASLLPIAYAKSLGLSVHVIPVRRRLDLLAIRKLRAHLEIRGTKILHAHDVKASTYAWFSSLPTRSWKLVSTHHSVGRVGLKLLAYERFYSSFVLRRFDRALTVCSSDKEILLARGFPREKIETHLNGVDRVKVHPGERSKLQAKIRTDWGLAARGISTTEPTFGIVARLDPEKNHFLALDAFSELDRKNPAAPWVVLCFGNGNLEGKLHERTRELCLERRVHWMGYRSGLGEEIAGLDLLLSFSSYEGLPINLLEAGWAGTPILSSPLGGVLDLVRPGTDGELLSKKWTPSEAAAKIEKLSLDRARLTELGKNLQTRVETHFSETMWFSKLQTIYRALLVDI